MIAVTAPLLLWKGEKGSWHFVSIPDGLCSDLRAAALTGGSRFGSVRVEAAIGDVVWSTSVFPQKGGGYLLPVKAEIRRRATVTAGDMVTVALTPL